MLLEKELSVIESLLDKIERHNDRVSAAAVGWHIDHLLRVIIGMSRALQKSNPEDYKWQFNPARLVVLTFNFMPRGRGRAPKSVVAHEEIDEAGILKLLQEAGRQLSLIEDLPDKSNFNHPYFGLLNLRQTKNIIQIHTRHHLKIARDIIA
jgi:hypothetical protein